MIKVILLVLISEIWSSTGHLLFKKSTNAMEFHSLRSLNSKLRFIKSVILKQAIWLGILFIAIGLVIWIFALASGELSIVYPLSSLEYVIILFFARFFLDEKMDRMKLTGTALVMLGIICITLS